MNNLNNQTILDNFMEKPELIKKVLSKSQATHKFVNNDGISIVGFCGMFRTSRR